MINIENMNIDTLQHLFKYIYSTVGYYTHIILHCICSSYHYLINLANQLDRVELWLIIINGWSLLIYCILATKLIVIQDRRINYNPSWVVKIKILVILVLLPAFIIAGFIICNFFWLNLVLLVIGPLTVINIFKEDFIQDKFEIFITLLIKLIFSAVLAVDYPVEIPIDQCI